MGRSFRTAGLVAGFLGSFYIQSAIAQEIDYFELSPEALLSVEVVSATKKAEKLSETPVAAYVITHDDIIRSGVTTIPDALRMAPGVNVAQSDSNTWAVSIRGFNANLANKLLVLVDGRTAYNPLFGGTYWETQDLVLEDIDRIEIIRGPGGALWGANAMNGVINIITKSARETQDTLVQAGFGNYEQGFASVRHGVSIGDEGYFRAYAKAFNRDSYKTPGGEDATDEWHSYRGGFRADWSDDFTVQGDVYRTVSDSLAQNYSLTAPYTSAEPEEITSKGGNLLGRWNKELENEALLSVQSYIDYTKRNEQLLHDDRFIFDVEAQYNFPVMEKHELIAGAGYRYMIDDLAGSSFVSFSPASRQDPLYNAFIQDKITLAPDEWYLTLGSKFEHNHYTGFEFQPNARLQWFPDDRQTVWTSVSRAIRTPSRIERDLDLTNLVIGPALLGLPAEVRLTHNPSFDSEKLLAYEAGYRNQIHSGLSLDVAAFYNEYHDLLALELPGLIPVAGPPAHFIMPLVAKNDESAETYGIELATQWDVTGNWAVTGTYSYLEMFVHSPALLGFRQDTEEGFAPVHQASLRSSWDLSENWTLDTGVYYVDQLPQSDVKDYVRLDVNLGWRISETLRFNLTGQNLLDDAHREFNSPDSTNASEVERSVFGKLTWQF